MKELLINLRACKSAKIWAANKTWPEIYATCHRGDWLLWLFKRTNPDDLQLLTLAKGHCANTVRHLMKDARSIAAVDAAIAFGEGKITKKELADAAADAAAAYVDSGFDAAAAAAAYVAAPAADADAAANDAADDAADAAYAAAAADAADDVAHAAAAAVADAAGADADDARGSNQLLTANLVRQFIHIDKWNIHI